MMTARGDATAVAKVEYEAVVDDHSGGVAVRIPVPTTPARALTPQLVLAGGGGGPSIVGHGWTASGFASVTIDSSEHLPRWDGSDGVALGGEPLVPWLDAGGAPRTRVEGAYRVTTLRPRSGFARVRVERWTHTVTGDVHFRSREAADVLTIYGARPAAAARIVDPADPRRVAAWLPELQVDADGNAIWLDYAPEDARGVDRTQPWEPARPVRTQRYLTAVHYGNVTPLVVTDAIIAGEAPGDRWAFHLVIDHGDHGDDVPTFAPDRPWPARIDAHASARDGFAVRTYRRVRRFVCFHDVPALGPVPVPVSALELAYDDDPAGARLVAVTRVGFVGDRREATAPLAFTYAGAGVDESFLPASTATGLTAARTQLVDLYGEGLAGILYQGERGWLFQANRGGGQFAAPAAVAAQPNLERGVALADVDRDGDTELAVTTGRQAGSFALEREERRWAGFRPFAAWPKVEGTVGRTFWVDLNGDGRADAVMAPGDALVWLPSKPGPLDEIEREFGEPVVVPLPTGAEAAPGCGPNPQLDLFFADMTGDGLPDLVRVRRGTVEYWPCLGNGRFGERVVMGGAPLIPTATGFDSARVRLVDLDGSGTADLLYLDDGRLWHFPNLGGRQLGARREVGQLPTFDGRSAAIADLAGDGRPALLWSATSPTRGHALSYLPLVPPTPPGMLIAIDDGCGRRTELEWGNSATHYLRDAAAGVPWETRLPSHRPVIDARVEYDLIGGTAVTTRYRYRDGYFDGAGGAFRGFGRVETLDVPQAIPRPGGGPGDGLPPAPDEPAFAVPLLTRTWFHLGTPMWNHHRPFEPYTGDALLPRLAPHAEAAGALSSVDAAAALRLLAGSVVRRERWAVDADEAPVAHPFDVEEASYQLVLSQPRRGAQRPVFGVTPRVRRVATYEGQGGDPRVIEELVVAHDVWGAPTRSAQVAYARRGAAADAAQARTWITITDAIRTDVDVDAQFLLGAAVATTQLELVGVAPVGGRLGVEALTAAAVTAALASPAPFEASLDPAATSPAARRLAWQRTYYWDAAREAPVPLGVVPKAPRVHHAEVACLTPGLVAATLDGRIDATGLAALGYVLADGHWWQRGPVQEVGGPFGLVMRTVRGDGATAEQVYDSDQLAVTEQLDALGLSSTMVIDYRVMAPERTIDPNGTTTNAAYDGFGRVVASGAEGHVGAQPWRSSAHAEWAPPSGTTTATVLADPAGLVGKVATATWHDDRAWARDATPPAQVTVARTSLFDDGDGGHGDDAAEVAEVAEVAVRYLDGFGRVLQEKVRVEPGPAIQRDGAGAVIVDAGGRPVLAPTTERWRVSGHVVYDAKGQPGRVYEPYFSPSAAYESDAVLERFGVSTLTTYDAMGRPVRVDLPNGTYATTTYGAWATTAATPGDNVLDSTYRVVREGRPVDDAERVAYEHAAGHAETPTVTHVDARGVTCAVEAVGDASAGARTERSVLDATGHVVATIDARGLTAFTYARDLRGRPLAQTSVDAGPTWALADAYDRPVWTWDGRGFAVARSFDLADRPTAVHVTGGDGAAAMDAVVETYRYGDQDADRDAAMAANTVGRLIEVQDGAGVVRVSTYDPLGAVRASARQLRAKVNEVPDWRTAEELESEALATAARTDALGRTVWTRLVDGTEEMHAYHPGGALVAVRVTTPDGALVDVPIVDGLARDAHGRVAAATLGGGCAQSWAYDPASGRLVAQDAVWAGRTLQGLRFTYDADGRMTRALDLAQEGAGALVPAAVSARRDFAYDVHGRLLEATGRVHQALLPHDYIPGTAGTLGGARHLSLNNGAALERYTQQFTYDASGNLTRMQHAGATASWSTDYWVAAASNRSTAALDPNGVPVVDPAAQFDVAGNMTALAHLRRLAWSWRGCLTDAVTIERPSGPVDDHERYAYGADRVRVRKLATRLVVGGSNPVIETREVVYLGNQERIRVRRGATLVLERWTTHVADGDRRVAIIDRHVVDTLAAEVDAIGPARVRYHLTTPQGSTALELDELGQLISYEEYLPHGGSAFIAGDDARDVARRDVRYAGKERDRATGLHAYPQRYYAPWLGRWLSPDPIGPKDGLNLYAFVGGDPIGYVDPEGTDRRAADEECTRHTEPVAREEAWQRQTREATADPAVYNIVDADGHVLAKQVYDYDAQQWGVYQPPSNVAFGTANDPYRGETTLEGNQDYEAQYNALHEYTVEGGVVDTITSKYGSESGAKGHAQFRTVDDAAGRHYQVYARVGHDASVNWGWQEISLERFEYFRNVNAAYERGDDSWALLAAGARVANPTQYFTAVFAEEDKARDQFRTLWTGPNNIANYYGGVVYGLGETVRDLVLMPYNAAKNSTLGKTALASRNDAQADAEGGWLGFVNSFNPVYDFMVNAYEAKKAAARGDYTEAGRRSAHASVAVADTVMLVGGLSKAVMRGAGRLSEWRSAREASAAAPRQARTAAEAAEGTSRDSAADRSIDYNPFRLSSRDLRRVGVNPLNMRRLRREMERSEIGRKVLAAVDEDVITLEISTAHVPSALLGESVGRVATVFLRSTQSYVRTAETAIHEGIHALGVGGSVRAEALARIGEAMHRGEVVTFARMKQILTEIRSLPEVYGHLPSRKGKWSSFFPGVRF